VAGKKNFNLKSFLINRLRRASFAYPPRTQAMQEARVERGIYRCAYCVKEGKDILWKAKQVKVDHIQPVVDPAVGFIDWNNFISRLFCEKEGFQILCEAHHHAKTEQENLGRKNKRRKKK
jgi:hypothetical protein